MQLWGVLVLGLIMSFGAFGLEKEPRVMPRNGVDKALLGQILFFDKTLSYHGNQNCASCHDPNTAFVDHRTSPAKRIVSQGSDVNLYGSRNSPTIMYGKFTPEFQKDEKTGEYFGGFFWDGRAQNLMAQAGMPILDPNEMGMPNKKSVVARLYQIPMYRGLFPQHFGDDVWESVESAYSALEKAIMTFQTSKKVLAPFDSKYDKFLAGEYKMTEKEEKGMNLFFDKKQTNCSNCHQLQKDPQAQEETFTNYYYYNIGVPSNRILIGLNEFSDDYVDNGLLDNPAVDDKNQKGKFKTPTLRNIAITYPYMHNGVFNELKTVLLFLDSFNNDKRKINPETGEPWDKPEYKKTINHDKLKAKPLSDSEIDALEAFLRTLTDERYEPLLEKS